MLNDKAAFKLILIVALLQIPLFAQYERPGSASAQFLKIGVSPRGAAMGNSYITAANGAEAGYYNPAKLSRLTGSQFAISHTGWFAGVSHDFMAISHNFGRIGAFGLSITNFHTDPMKVRTPLKPEGTGETFRVDNYRGTISYSLILTDHVSFGANLHYIRLQLYDGFIQNEFATDLAALYRTYYRGFKFGLMVSNFGSSVTFVNEQYPLPVSFIFGTEINAIEKENQTLTVTLSGLKPNDSQTMVKSGLEWNYSNLFFLRAGYQFNHDSATYSTGMGVRAVIGERNMNADYSFSPYGKLGNVHRFGVSFTL